jgi:SprT-like family protein
MRKPKKQSSGLNEKEHEASIQPALRELERLYLALAPLFGNLLGDERLNGLHSLPRIIVQTRGRRRSVLGWFAPQRWSKGEDAPLLNEITICAEALDRPAHSIVATLLHEMVHLSNYRASISDVGKDGRYHNQKFKTKAEAVGLVVEKDLHVGWAVTSLSAALEKKVSRLNVNAEAFAVFRVQPQEREKQPTKMKKWECGCTIVRCAVQLDATCEVCGNVFVLTETGVQPYSRQRTTSAEAVNVTAAVEMIDNVQMVLSLMTMESELTDEQREAADMAVATLEDARVVLYR